MGEFPKRQGHPSKPRSSYAIDGGLLAKASQVEWHWIVRQRLRQLEQSTNYPEQPPTQQQRLPMKHSNLYDKHHCDFETRRDVS